jgi:hypothetical protein
LAGLEADDAAVMRIASPLLSPACHLPPDSDMRISTHSFVDSICTRLGASVALLFEPRGSSLIALPYPAVVGTAVVRLVGFDHLPVAGPEPPTWRVNHPVVTVNSFSTTPSSAFAWATMFAWFGWIDSY